ncbi:MAG: hypothetical protein HYZ53_17820 [Planctomycetes bacterium]|nr:hypothetical protein [Planctomycetota bacterium]
MPQEQAPGTTSTHPPCADAGEPITLHGSGPGVVIEPTDPAGTARVGERTRRPLRQPPRRITADSELYTDPLPIAFRMAVVPDDAPLFGTYLLSGGPRSGMVLLLFAREFAGEVWSAFYLVDRWGLGLREAFRTQPVPKRVFRELGPAAAFEGAGPFERCAPRLARQLLWGGVLLARRHGLSLPQERVRVCAFAGEPLVDAEVDWRLFQKASASLPSADAAGARADEAGPATAAELGQGLAAERTLPDLRALEAAIGVRFSDESEWRGRCTEEDLWTEIASMRDYARANGGRAARWPAGAPGRLRMPEPSPEDLESVGAGWPAGGSAERGGRVRYEHREAAVVADAVRDWMSVEPVAESEALVRLRWTASLEAGGCVSSPRPGREARTLGQIRIDPFALVVECPCREDLYAI